MIQLTGRTTAKEWALFYAALGWRVFPVHEMSRDGVCSCEEGGVCDRPGKHPRTVAGIKEATTLRNDIEVWWSRWPGASVGIATGKESDLTVVDADCSKGKPGLINLTALCGPNGGLPATLICNTGGGGLHLYFKWTEKLKTGSDVIAEAIDVRSDGGFVIAPPSNHESGGTYKWRSETAALLEAPAWLCGAAVKGGKGGKKRGRGRPRITAGEKIERVESMLAAIDPDDRDRWLGIGVILGRLYVGTPLENDGWALYDSWASRSGKFDEDRTGNMARMREAYYETSQAEGRGAQLSIGSIIHWAREGGWKPFGDRASVAYEPGNESVMCEQLVQSLIDGTDNRFFNVMGQIRDVLKTQMPVTRMMQAAYESGKDIPETLVVRQTQSPSLLDALSRVAVLESVNRQGDPVAIPIAGSLAAMILGHHAPRFPALSGIAEWPMVGANGELISKEHGYDEATGLFFDIDRNVKLDEAMTVEAAWGFIKTEMLVDFPFENETHEAGALALLLAFMQRPLMKTCPGFATVAPQAGTGKGTLIELASMGVHGYPVANHAFSDENEELRKAVHSLLLAKFPAVMFDNITRGRAISSDVIAKLLTSEMSTDRTLGASETRKEVNSLLVTFTGNNIAFVKDLASRFITVKLNAKVADPLGRKFRHKDILSWAGAERNRILSALVAIARAGMGLAVEGKDSRFSDFDRFIVGPVFAATGQDCRKLLEENAAEEAEEDDSMLSALKLLRQWQSGWRNEGNGCRWKLGELLEAINSEAFDEKSSALLRGWTGDSRAWENDPRLALSYALRNANGDHKFAPYVLANKIVGGSAQWFVEGPEQSGEKQQSGAF